MIKPNSSGKILNKKAAAVTIIFIAAAFIFLFCHCGYYLVLSDCETGKTFAKYRLSEGDRFSVTFVHSVNKTPLTDIYEIENKKIYVKETVYYSFGAGVQTQIEEGQKLTYGESGEMIVSGFNIEMTNLSYIVGTVSDHTLTINNQEISLRNLCGRNSKVNFTYKFCIF